MRRSYLIAGLLAAVSVALASPTVWAAGSVSTSPQHGSPGATFTATFTPDSGRLCSLTGGYVSFSWGGSAADSGTKLKTVVCDATALSYSSGPLTPPTSAAGTYGVWAYISNASGGAPTDAAQTVYTIDAPAPTTAPTTAITPPLAPTPTATATPSASPSPANTNIGSTAPLCVVGTVHHNNCSRPLHINFDGGASSGADDGKSPTLLLAAIGVTIVGLLGWGLFNWKVPGRRATKGLSLAGILVLGGGLGVGGLLGGGTDLPGIGGWHADIDQDPGGGNLFGGGVSECGLPNPPLSCPPPGPEFATSDDTGRIETAKCGSGRVVIGGGWTAYVSGYTFSSQYLPAPARAVSRVSKPSDDGKAWIAGEHYFPEKSGGPQLDVQSICASQPPGYEVVTQGPTTVTTLKPLTVTADCPANKVVLSGAWSISPQGARISKAAPKDDGSGFSVTAPTYLSAGETLSVSAICANKLAGYVITTSGQLSVPWAAGTPNGSVGGGVLYPDALAEAACPGSDLPLGGGWQAPPAADVPGMIAQATPDFHGVALDVINDSIDHSSMDVQAWAICASPKALPAGSAPPA